MIDPGEFLNSYSEWHYLWLGIFLGFIAGFTAGVYLHRRLRAMVQEDVLRSLSSLRLLPRVQDPGDRLVNHRIAGVERKLTTQMLESKTDVNGARYATMSISTTAPKTTSGIELLTDSKPDR